MADWKDVIVSPDTTLGEAIAKVDSAGLQVALVLAADTSLLGILTDGNIRRAILAGKGLQVPVSTVMNVRPTTVTASTPRDEMLALMRRKVLHHLPVVDDAGHMVGLVTLDEIIGASHRPNWVVLMAGGLGTRLQPLTDDCPKPLLEVGGKPILETILESFAEQGFKQIFLSVNYKAEMIRNHFGSGDRWGVQVEYLHEGPRLGTAGALSLLPKKPTAPVVVMNGDLLTRPNFENILQFHLAQGAVATMVVREYDFRCRMAWFGSMARGSKASKKNRYRSFSLMPAFMCCHRKRSSTCLQGHVLICLFCSSTWLLQARPLPPIPYGNTGWISGDWMISNGRSESGSEIRHESLGAWLRFYRRPTYSFIGRGKVFRGCAKSPLN